MRSPARWPSFVSDRPTRRTCSVRQLSPDGTTLYFRAFDDRRENSLVMARDLRSGAEREVYRFSGQVGWPSLSEDGKQLAFAVREPATRQTSIVVLPTTEGRRARFLRCRKAMW